MWHASGSSSYANPNTHYAFYRPLSIVPRPSSAKMGGRHFFAWGPLGRAGFANGGTPPRMIQTWTPRMLGDVSTGPRQS